MATESVQPILNAILEIGETFAATLRLEAVLDSVIESGMRLAGGDSGSVMLLSDDGRELVVTAAVGPRASIILGTRQPASASGNSRSATRYQMPRGSHRTIALPTRCPHSAITQRIPHGVPLHVGSGSRRHAYPHRERERAGPE